jgi:glucan 1,3-beta-glucosidase
MNTFTLKLVLACCGVFSALSLPMRGVNLGGWMVLESWIYPLWWVGVTNGTVPGGVGEYQFCGIVGKARCTEILTTHWDTWYTFSDMQTLASAGITHVRIPIGYWIAGPQFFLQNDTYITGGWVYLQRMLGWLNQVGIQAVIDLHGAPGSQNGHDNSGNSAGIGWDTPANINLTISVLEYLAANLTIINKTAGYEGVVAGIEVLNEPWTTAVNGPISFQTLQDFIQRAADAILTTGWTGMIWFPDGWNLYWPGWEGFLAPPKYQNIFVDQHLYHCFGGYNFSRWAQINYTCNVDLPRLKSETLTDWVVVGEYSLCMPSIPTFPYTLDDTVLLRSYAEAQMQAYGVYDDTSSSKGAFFWNAKTEDSYEWSYLDGLQYGYAPNFTQPRTESGFDCTAF